MSFFGLDIGTSSFKLVKVMRTGGTFGIEAIGAVTNPMASVDFADVTQRQRASDALKKMLGEVGIKERRVVIGISESKVYSRVVKMPIMSDAELSSAITWEAEQFVPVPIAEIEMDYSVVRRPPAGSKETEMLVYLLASPKKYLSQVVDFVVGVGLEPIAIESEIVAVTRSLTLGGMVGTNLIVHIGASSTVIAIADGDALLFSYVVPTGGIAMTRALSQTLNFPLPQAEEYKRTYGLDQSQFEGKVRSALMVVLASLVNEIRKAVEYHGVQYKATIARILLSGGGAYLPDLAPYLSGEFPGIEVVVADPFAKGRVPPKMKLPADRAGYSVAAGLSLREL